MPRAKGINRRQAIRIIAASAALPLGLVALQTARGQSGYETWHGLSLGGPASLTVWHENPAFARATILRLRSEIERLEAVFSLFRNDSEIVQLNRAGRLDTASSDLRTVLVAAQDMAEISRGAFDPTVQPLWRLYEGYFLSNPDSLSGPAEAAVAAARALVNYRLLDIGSRSVRLGRPGMAITLNGIAQGYITDRVADLLRAEGFEHAVVEVGETRALGTQPDGSEWSFAIKDPFDPAQTNRKLLLSEAALSVSGGYGTPFGRSRLHHIFDPATGGSAQSLVDVVVVAPRAILADALSTAIYVSGEACGAELVSPFSGTRAMVTRPDGTCVALGQFEQA